MLHDSDHWDKRDYLAFVLYFLAQSDGVLEEKEVHYITARIGEESLAKIKAVSEECSDSQCLEIMQELRQQFYPDELGKESLILEMKEFCSADDHFNPIETRVVQLISQQL